ncbi:MAG TPA: hypothetical protein VMU44_00290 [Steroidobacteraceae bacterium]|nr:hypothetical protein [Steroidobacteraceae bacterium]
MTWRRALRRHLTLLLLAKFAALALLWALCFSGPHRTLVDAGVAGRRLGLVQAHGSPGPAPAPPGESTRD